MNRPINVTPAQQAAALAAFISTALPLPNARTALAGSGQAAGQGHVHPLPARYMEILAQSGAAITLADGNLVGTDMVVIPIPAGLLGKNSRIIVDVHLNGIGTGNKTFGVFWGPFASQKKMYSAAFTSTALYRLQGVLVCNNSYSAQWCGSTTAVFSAIASSYTDTIDTLNNGHSIVLYGKNAQAGDVLSLLDYSVQHFYAD